MDASELLCQEIERTSVGPLADDIDIDKIGAYRSYSELLECMQGLVKRGARLRCVGRTVLDEPIFAVVLGPKQASMTSVILGGIHPIEWIGIETGFALLERLVNAPPTDRTVLACPVINVDGYRRVEFDLRVGRRRWHRTNARGVDLNRNWPTHHTARQSRIVKYSYGGPFPLSEPEIAGIANTLDEFARHSRIDVALSLHSVGRILFTPYGGTWRAPRAAPTLLRAARSIQRRLTEPYRIRQASRWIPGVFPRGTELDHLYARYRAITILVECSAGGRRWRAPSSFLHPFRWFNPPELQATAHPLACAIEPFIRGQF